MNFNYGECWLKTSDEGKKLQSGAVSGPRECRRPDTFVASLNLPKNCEGRLPQTRTPYSYGTISAHRVVLPSDPTTYQNDLEADGRGVVSSEHQWWDFRAGNGGDWLDWPSSGPGSPLRFKCSFKYYHLNRAATVYSIVVRANPNDFTDHDAARTIIAPYLESVGRIPEILFTQFKTLTVNGPWLQSGGPSARVGEANGDITINVGFTFGDASDLWHWWGEEFIFSGALLSLKQFLSWTDYKLAIEKDCNDFLSKWAKQDPERFDLAESFVAYFGLRYKPERLGQILREESIEVGPNRMKFFFDNVDPELSSPPLAAPGFGELIQAVPQPAVTPPALLLVRNQSLDELADAYRAEAAYKVAMGLEGDSAAESATE